MGRDGMRGWLAIVVFAVVACSRAPAPEAPAPAGGQPSAAGQASAPFARYAVEPVPVPASFAAAIELGTRTTDGRPGPRYWQQRVRYVIAAELEPQSARVSGEETITYYNHSPDTLGFVVLHLYQNLFKAGEARVERVPITGGITLERVSAGGSTATFLEDDVAPPPTGAAYRIDGTLMAVRLPRALLPGDSTRLELAWHFTVPPAGAPRTGHVDHTLYNVAQWYPQVAVYDDVDGWDTWPYLGQGEFYLEYGDWDVSLSLPEGWIVAATGTLENPAEVLSERVRQRLRSALERDDVVRVITRDDLGPGNATQRAPGGRLTWRFRATNVRDFAFGTSDRYLWDAARATSPDANGDGRRETVAVHALYRPEAGAWREAARYTKHALEFHATRWHPYRYPHITAAEGPIFGMEYPMLVFVQPVSEPRLLYSVINHEVGHMWFPMLVGSNESAFAWQDEGLTTYIETLATADFFRDSTAYQHELQQYLALAGSELEMPLMRRADLYGPGPAYALASYSKPVAILRALGGVIGEEKLHQALREYTTRWSLKHPTALDFFNTVESVVGRDLDWFWHPWWYETAVFDQAITSVTTTAAANGERVTITIADEGEAPLPIELVLTLANGKTQRVTVPVDVWLSGARQHTETVETAARVERVEIDPGEWFPDVNRADNVWQRGGS